MKKNKLLLLALLVPFFASAQKSINFTENDGWAFTVAANDFDGVFHFASLECKTGSYPYYPTMIVRKRLGKTEVYISNIGYTGGKNKAVIIFDGKRKYEPKVIPSDDNEALFIVADCGEMTLSRLIHEILNSKRMSVRHYHTTVGTTTRDFVFEWETSENVSRVIGKDLLDPSLNPTKRTIDLDSIDLGLINYDIHIEESYSYERKRTYIKLDSQDSLDILDFCLNKISKSYTLFPEHSRGEEISVINSLHVRVEMRSVGNGKFSVTVITNNDWKCEEYIHGDYVTFRDEIDLTKSIIIPETIHQRKYLDNPLNGYTLVTY